MMKKTLLIAALVLSSLGIHAEDGVILHLKDGSKVGFVFSKKPTIKTGTTLSIKTVDREVEYDYSTVKSVSFGDVNTTAISQAKNEAKGNSVFRLTATGLEVEGLKAGETVSIYGMDGKLINAAKATNGAVSVALPEGNAMYVVRTSNGTSFKFNKK